MEDIKVLLVDDNAELRHSLRITLAAQDGIAVVGECSNGQEALDFLSRAQADVVLLDIIMPQMDGYTFMEELSRRGGDQQPQVIVLSALGRDDFIMRAVELGARYYMIKPVENSVLISRIRDVCGRGVAVAESVRISAVNRTPTIDEKLAGLFLTIGIPAHIKGYQYLREAVKMVIENPDVINRITKELYPGIGRRFATTASKVERAIRHAIEVAWSRGRIDTLNRAFGCKVATREDKPTNGEFIAMIADKLALEQRSA